MANAELDSNKPKLVYNSFEDYKPYFKTCYDIARQSPDPSNQNGALVLDRYTLRDSNNGGDIVIEDCNRFPNGTEYTQEQLLDRDWKLFHIEHAERNAIFKSIRLGILTNDLTMVCPWFACGDCARAILLCGIKKVVGHKERMDQTPERWKASVEAGLNMLRNGGVELEFYSGTVGCYPIVVNGKRWYP